MIDLTPDRFQGRWHVSRRLEDALGAQSGHFEGEATLVPSDMGLRYSEHGTLTLDQGGAFRAERVYCWQFIDGRVEVRFDDGRAFHSFGANGLGTDHPCGDDHYRVRYDFTDWPAWRARWTVTGPRKAYVSDTTFTPLPLRSGAERA